MYDASGNFKFHDAKGHVDMMAVIDQLVKIGHNTRSDVFTAAMKDYFGQTAGGQMLPVFLSDAVQAQLNRTKKSFHQMGDVPTQFSAYMSDLNPNINRFLTTLQNTIAIIGRSALPQTTAYLKAMGDALGNFNMMLDQHPEVAKSIFNLALGFGILTSAIWFLSMAFKFLAPTLNVIKVLGGLLGSKGGSGIGGAGGSSIADGAAEAATAVRGLAGALAALLEGVAPFMRMLGLVGMGMQIDEFGPGVGTGSSNWWNYAHPRSNGKLQSGTLGLPNLNIINASGGPVQAHWGTNPGGTSWGAPKHISGADLWNHS
jgi:hypothetical protein